MPGSLSLGRPNLSVYVESLTVAPGCGPPSPDESELSKQDIGALPCLIGFSFLLPIRKIMKHLSNKVGSHQEYFKEF